MKRITLHHLRLIPAFLRYTLLLRQRSRHLPKAPIQIPSKGTVDLHMQVGKHRGIDAVIALETALEFLPFSFNVYIHPDSRVTVREVNMIQCMLPAAKLSSAETTVIVMDRLREKRLANLARFRSEHRLAKKLVDALIIGESSTIVVLDDDCLAFSFASELANLRGNFCLQDPSTENYSKPYNDIRNASNITLHRSLNSGFIRYEKTDHDLTFLDHAIGQCQLPMNHFTEQTLWALLLCRSELTVLDRFRYQVGSTDILPTTRLIHYVGHYLGNTKLQMRRGGQARAVAAARAHRETTMSTRTWNSTLV